MAAKTSRLVSPSRFGQVKFGGSMKAFFRNASIVWLFILPVFAQIQSARVEGTVIDSSKAAIPGAKLSLTNNATQVKMDAEADASGFFTFPTVPTGFYTLTAEAQGFR